MSRTEKKIFESWSYVGQPQIPDTKERGFQTFLVLLLVLIIRFSYLDQEMLTPDLAALSKSKGEINHVQLETWALGLGATAILGFVCTLLILGKVLHFAFTRKNLFCGYFLLAPSVLSGLFGLAALAMFRNLDIGLADDLQSGLECVVTNLQSFVFSSLILGLHSSSSSNMANQSVRGVMLSIVHEGLPMMVYSQMLIWGHSFCCLLVLAVMGLYSKSVPQYYYAALVPNGIETGGDVIIATHSATAGEDNTILSEAEAIGLVTTCIACVVLISARPWLQAQGWLSANRGRNSGDMEEITDTFGRSNRSRGTGGAGIGGSRNESNADALDALEHNILTPSSKLKADGDILSSALAGANSGSAAAAAAGSSSIIEAGLGAHLSLIALTAFLSFGITLLAHLLEIKFAGHFGTIFTSVRMFKLAMFSSLTAMLFITKLTRVSFKREWFMLLCGLFLDLVFISALTKSLPRSVEADKGHTHFMAVTGLVLVMLMWNVICYIAVARHMFPNFHFERALVLSASAMGNSYSGLLFARLMDPSLNSPVPAAFAAKLLLFFIPSSAAKNKIVGKFLQKHGIWITLAICSCIVAAWYLIIFSSFRSTAGASDVSDGSSVPLLARTDDSSHQESDSAEASPRRSKRCATVEDSAESTSGTETATSPQAAIEMRSHSSKSAKTGADAPGALPELIDVKLSEPSGILQEKHLQRIAGWMSTSQRSRGWELVYSLVRDGASMTNLLSQCRAQRAAAGREMAERNVLIIEDSMGYIFGAYLGHPIEMSSHYYGTGESFVFQISPVPKVYRWTRANDLFFTSDRFSLAVGGGGDGFALQLDEDLDTGVSTRSATYDNEILSSGEFFRVLHVELWSLKLFGG